jgi:hypothetical protein
MLKCKDKSVRSQAKLFDEIWEERPHYSEVSGRPLLPKGHPQWYWQFAHVLNKGTYTYYRLNKENIMLMLPEEHAKQEFFPLFQAKHELLKAQYNEKFKIKTF